MRNVRFRNFQSGVCVSVKTSRVLSSIHAVANQRHTTTKLKEVRRGPRASQKGKTANPFPVFLFIYFFFPYPLFQAEQFSFRFDGTGHGLRDSINTHHWIFSFVL